MAVIVPILAKFDPKGVNQAKKGFEGLSKGLKKTLAGIGIGIGIGALVQSLKAAGKAAAEDAKSQALLASSLRNTINATNDQISVVEQSIKKLELMSSVADDTIRPAFATIAAVTKDIGQATSLTTIALDMAAAGYGNLETNSKALAKAYAGQTGALDKLVPGVKNATDKFGYLEQRFKGAAAEAANLDPYTRLNLIFGNLQESIGSYILPYLNDFADWLASPPGQAQIAKIAQTFGAVAVNVGRIVGWLLDNTWLVKTVAGVVLWGKAMAFVFTVSKAIYGVIKATAIGQYITKAVTAAKSWQQALVIGGIATATGIAAFVAVDALIGNIGKNVDGLKSDVGTLGDIKIPAGNLPVIDGSGTASAKAQTAAQKAAAEAAAKAAAAAQAVADALNKEREALAEFKTELMDLSAGIEPLKAVERQIGEFESAAVSGFDAITESIKNGLANKTITEDAARNLRNYVQTERTALEAIARQRDELATKRSLVETLIGDVKSAVVGYANITDMLESQTRTVEKTITRIVNGMSIATKQTIEEVVSGNGLVGNLQDVVSRTKAFALQLKQLRELGLDQNLYKQIVDAGIEAGSTTAAEIIKGGAGTVSELNALFKELNDVGTQIAEDTALVMYNNGVAVAGGLVAGLRSQEQALVDAATALATAFTSTYNKIVGDLKTPMESQTLTLSIQDIAAGNTGVAIAADNTLRNMASTYLKRFGSTSGAPVTITVNAGVGTNGKAVGQAIYNELNKYLKSSVVTG